LSGGTQPGAETTDGIESDGIESGRGGAPASRRPRDWLREQRKLPRRRLVTVAAIGIVLFLVLSVLLARYLAVENTERDDVLTVLRAETAGDASGVIAHISGCSTHPGCVAQATQNAANLRRSGAVKILSLTSHSAYSLTSATAHTRVAWTVIGRLPVVQCVTVKRTGNFLTGLAIALLAVSKPISNEGDC
jgi:hypothetical protein